MEGCRDEIASIVLAVAIILIAFIFIVLTMQAFAWLRVSRRGNTWVKLILVLAVVIVSTYLFSFL